MSTTTTQPRRIQMRRTKGWRKPEGAVYVGRPSKWGNPYRVADHGETAVDLFEAALYRCLEGSSTEPHAIEIRVIAESLDELAGKDLACWCGMGIPCHADVLLQLANRAA